MRQIHLGVDRNRHLAIPEPGGADLVFGVNGRGVVLTWMRRCALLALLGLLSPGVAKCVLGQTQIDEGVVVEFGGDVDLGFNAELFDPDVEVEFADRVISQQVAAPPPAGPSPAAAPPAAPRRAEPSAAEPPAADAPRPVVPLAIPMVPLRPALRVLPGQLLTPAMPAAPARPAAAEVPRWGAASETPLLPKGAADWKYWDRTEAPAADWFRNDFDDAAWKVGKAPLGYSERFIATTISQELPLAARPLVSYFRRHVEWHPGENQGDELGLLLLCDDAAAIYINGVEVHRQNLAPGPLDHQTRSTTAVTGSQEGQYVAVIIDTNPLREGDNLIAVSVHQTNQTSNDSAFDLEIHVISGEMAQQIAINHPAGGDMPDAAARQASFRRITQFELRAPLIRSDDGAVQRTARSNSLTLQQIRQRLPRARFQWVYEGDSLKSVSQLCGVDVDSLAILNAVPPDYVFVEPGIVCIEWLHKVRRSESWKSISELYGVELAVLERLNPTAYGKWLLTDQLIRVRGKYTYHLADTKAAMFQATVFCQESPPQLRVTRTQDTIAEGEDLARFAARHRVDPVELARRHGISTNTPLHAGEILCLESHCVVPEPMTVGDLATLVGEPADRLCVLNRIDDENEILEVGRMIDLPSEIALVAEDPGPFQGRQGGAQIRVAQRAVRGVPLIVRGVRVLGRPARMNAAENMDEAVQLVEWHLGSAPTSWTPSESP